MNVKANDLLGEVLGNVITNAVDHNDTDGLRVSLAVDEERDDTDEFVTVRIADNGCGVPDESKEAIFRRDETGHAKSTGSGFGLFFVDSMVAEYGGDIWVEDNDPHGAVFMIKLLTPSQ
ncbi:sensor histidine kinase KdpD [Haladaptatus sp. DYSN1]|uniref:sensor histidine kinase n=1 Tax=unclassified Haladaptatus TaxID=2622732 RepID=UPI002404D0B9|nr:HAMP domain-containing sensor histidine kinase [Haladaptatus sp. DYSN1]